MSLTDSWLKTHHKKLHEKALERADGEGLSARVSPAGKVVFQMRFRYERKPARLDLGTYPLMSLKEARLEHQRLKAELERGHDPRVVRVIEKKIISTAPTNESLYRQWYESYCISNKKQHKDILRSFEIHVFPKIGDLPADKTSTHIWMSLLEDVSVKAPSIAERLMNETQQLHKWAARRGLIESRPLADLSASVDLKVARGVAGRALSDDEISLFWHSIDRSGMTQANKLFLKLCLFFGCRNGELREMNPSAELDFESMTWTVPPEKNKVRKQMLRPIVRPLIPEIVPMLKEAISVSRSRSFLFTQSGSAKKLETGGVLSMPYSVIKNAKKHFGVDMAHWSMHDLRKTARTNFSTLTHAHVAEVMLGHSLKGMQGVYDRHLYLEEQAAAYQSWWQRMMAIVEVAPKI